MAQFNDNIRVTKSSLRFGPLTIQRVKEIPPDTFGRIGDIVLVDDTKDARLPSQISQNPTLVGIFQKKYIR
jgi:hypothetical protein